MLKRRDFWEIYTHRNSVPLLCNNSSGAHHYFDNEPADQLVVIELASRKRSPHSHKTDPAFSLGVPADAFLRRIPPTHVHASQQQQQLQPPLVFAWEQWGEGRAVIKKRDDIDRRLPQLTRVCGLRGVSRKPVLVHHYDDDGAPVTTSMFRVVDLHPVRVARLLQYRAEGREPPGVGSLAPRHAFVEVPLPKEMQGVDPVLISTTICQDALIVFEVRVVWVRTLTLSCF